MVVEVRLFGALRRFGDAGIVRVDVPENGSVREIRDLVKQELSRAFPGEFKGELVDKAALASEDRVMRSEEKIGAGRMLALLPPVCGG